MLLTFTTMGMVVPVNYQLEEDNKLIVYAAFPYEFHVQVFGSHGSNFVVDLVTLRPAKMIS